MLIEENKMENSLREGFNFFLLERRKDQDVEDLFKIFLCITEALCINVFLYVF